MKKMVGVEAGSYTFDASAKTVTISGLGDLSLEQILLITNVTDNILIYNFADATKGGSMSNNVLTLDYDTAAMADSDSLQIFVNDTADQSKVSISDIYTWMRSLLNALVRPLWVNPLTGQVKAEVATVSTVTTCSTVSTVTTLANQTNIGAMDAKWALLFEQNRAAWAQNVRSRIS